MKKNHHSRQGILQTDHDNQDQTKLGRIEIQPQGVSNRSRTYATKDHEIYRHQLSPIIRAAELQRSTNQLIQSPGSQSSFDSSAELEQYFPMEGNISFESLREQQSGQGRQYPTSQSNTRQNSSRDLSMDKKEEASKKDEQKRSIGFPSYPSQIEGLTVSDDAVKDIIGGIQSRAIQEPFDPYSGQTAEDIDTNPLDPIYIQAPQPTLVLHSDYARLEAELNTKVPRPIVYRYPATRNQNTQGSSVDNTFNVAQPTSESERLATLKTFKDNNQKSHRNSTGRPITVENDEQIATGEQRTNNQAESSVAVNDDNFNDNVHSAYDTQGLSTTSFDRHASSYPASSFQNHFDDQNSHSQHQIETDISVPFQDFNTGSSDNLYNMYSSPARSRPEVTYDITNCIQRCFEAHRQSVDRRRAARQERKARRFHASRTTTNKEGSYESYQTPSNQHQDVSTQRIHPTVITNREKRRQASMPPLSRNYVDQVITRERVPSATRISTASKIQTNPYNYSTRDFQISSSETGYQVDPYSQSNNFTELSTSMKRTEYDLKPTTNFQVPSESFYQYQTTQEPYEQSTTYDYHTTPTVTTTTHGIEQQANQQLAQDIPYEYGSSMPYNTYGAVESRITENQAGVHTDFYPSDQTSTQFSTYATYTPANTVIQQSEIDPMGSSQEFYQTQFNAPTYGTIQDQTNATLEYTTLSQQHPYSSVGTYEMTETNTYKLPNNNVSDSTVTYATQPHDVLDYEQRQTMTNYEPSLHGIYTQPSRTVDYDQAISQPQSEQYNYQAQKPFQSTVYYDLPSQEAFIQTNTEPDQTAYNFVTEQQTDVLFPDSRTIETVSMPQRPSYTDSIPSTNIHYDSYDKQYTQQKPPNFNDQQNIQFSRTHQRTSVTQGPYRPQDSMFDYQIRSHQDSQASLSDISPAERATSYALEQHQYDETSPISQIRMDEGNRRIRINVSMPGGTIKYIRKREYADESEAGQSSETVVLNEGHEQQTRTIEAPKQTISHSEIITGSTTGYGRPIGPIEYSQHGYVSHEPIYDNQHLQFQNDQSYYDISSSQQVVPESTMFTGKQDFEYSPTGQAGDIPIDIANVSQTFREEMINSGSISTGNIGYTGAAYYSQQPFQVQRHETVMIDENQQTGTQVTNPSTAIPAYSEVVSHAPVSTKTTTDSTEYTNQNYQYETVQPEASSYYYDDEAVANQFFPNNNVASDSNIFNQNTFQTQNLYEQSISGYQAVPSITSQNYYTVDTSNYQNLPSDLMPEQLIEYATRVTQQPAGTTQLGVNTDFTQNEYHYQQSQNDTTPSTYTAADQTVFPSTIPQEQTITYLDNIQQSGRIPFQQSYTNEEATSYISQPDLQPTGYDYNRDVYYNQQIPQTYVTETSQQEQNIESIAQFTNTQDRIPTYTNISTSYQTVPNESLSRIEYTQQGYEYQEPIYDYPTASPVSTDYYSNITNTNTIQYPITETRTTEETYSYLSGDQAAPVFPAVVQQKRESVHIHLPEQINPYSELRTEQNRVKEILKEQSDYWRTINNQGSGDISENQKQILVSDDQTRHETVSSTDQSQIQEGNRRIRINVSMPGGTIKYIRKREYADEPEAGQSSETIVLNEGHEQQTRTIEAPKQTISHSEIITGSTTGYGRPIGPIEYSQHGYVSHEPIYDYPRGTYLPSGETERAEIIRFTTEKVIPPLRKFISEQIPKEIEKLETRTRTNISHASTDDKTEIVERGKISTRKSELAEEDRQYLLQNVITEHRDKTVEKREEFSEIESSKEDTSTSLPPPPSKPQEHIEFNQHTNSAESDFPPPPTNDVDSYGSLRERSTRHTTTFGPEDQQATLYVDDQTQKTFTKFTDEGGDDGSDDDEESEEPFDLQACIERCYQKYQEVWNEPHREQQPIITTEVYRTPRTQQYQTTIRNVPVSNRQSEIRIEQHEQSIHPHVYSRAVNTDVIPDLPQIQHDTYTSFGNDYRYPEFTQNTDQHTSHDTIIRRSSDIDNHTYRQPKYGKTTIHYTDSWTQTAPFDVVVKPNIIQHAYDQTPPKFIRQHILPRLSRKDQFVDLPSRQTIEYTPPLTTSNRRITQYVPDSTPSTMREETIYQHHERLRQQQNFDNISPLRAYLSCDDINKPEKIRFRSQIIEQPRQSTDIPSYQYTYDEYSPSQSIDTQRHRFRTQSEPATAQQETHTIVPPLETFTSPIYEDHTRRSFSIPAMNNQRRGLTPPIRLMDDGRSYEVNDSFRRQEPRYNPQTGEYYIPCPMSQKYAHLPPHLRPELYCIELPPPGSLPPPPPRPPTPPTTHPEGHFHGNRWCVRCCCVPGRSLIKKIVYKRQEDGNRFASDSGFDYSSVIDQMGTKITVRYGNEYMQAGEPCVTGGYNERLRVMDFPVYVSGEGDTNLTPLVPDN